MRGVVLQKASKTSLLQAEARPPRDARPHRPPPPCPQVMHRLSTGLSTAYPQARTYHKRVAHAHRLWVAGYTCASNAGQRKSGAAGAYASPAHTHALGAAGACAPRSHHPRTHPRTPTHTHRPDTGTHTGTTHSTHTHKGCRSVFGNFPQTWNYRLPQSSKGRNVSNIQRGPRGAIAKIPRPLQV